VSCAATQEFRKNLARVRQGGCCTIAVSGKQPIRAKGFHPDLGTPLPVRNHIMKPKNVSRLRVSAAGLLAAVGLSVLGSLAPAVASADPWVPGTGPLHPIRHYSADVLHPYWAFHHPIRATIP
jgi:hypothetical protein